MSQTSRCSWCAKLTAGELCAICAADLRAKLEQTQKDNTVYRRELQHALTYLDSLGAMEPHEPEAQMRESFHRVMRGEQVPDTSVKATCVCGHSKEAHIYHEGACRPGFACQNECRQYLPVYTEGVRQP